MTPSGFFTKDMLTHVHIQQFTSVSGLLEKYCTEAESEYVDLASQLGLTEDMIFVPIPTISTRYLNHYINYRFSEDSIATNNVVVSDDDMYVRLSDRSYERMVSLKKELTPEVIRGVSNNNRSSHAVSTGISFRRD